MKKIETARGHEIDTKNSPHPTSDASMRSPTESSDLSPEGRGSKVRGDRNSVKISAISWFQRNLAKARKFVIPAQARHLCGGKAGADITKVNVIPAPARHLCGGEAGIHRWLTKFIVFALAAVFCAAALTDVYALPFTVTVQDGAGSVAVYAPFFVYKGTATDGSPLTFDTSLAENAYTFYPVGSGLFIFSRWSNDPSGSPSVTTNPLILYYFGMGSNLYAFFTLQTQVTVKVGTGGGRIDVTRISPCYVDPIFLGSVSDTTGKTWNIDVDDQIKVEAFPDTNNSFEEFCYGATGTDCSTSNPLTLTIGEKETITGNFTGDTNPPPPDNNDKIGSSCAVVEKEFFGNLFYGVKHKDGSEFCGWDSSRDDAIYCGQGTTRCYDACLQDFAFLINGDDEDIDHNCNASSGDTIKTEILANFYAPHIGMSVKAVSTIKFPDGTTKDYYSASYTPSGSGIEMIQTTITRSDIVPSAQPYVFVGAKVVKASDNSVLFDSGSWAGGQCVVLNINLPPTPMPGSSFIYPGNAATGIPLTAALSWSASTDPEGATVYYDVYFGTTTSPAKVSSDQTGTTFDPPGQLAVNTLYYWHIVAKDATGTSGSTTRGPASGNWSFRTIAGDQVQATTDGTNYPAYGNNYVAQSFRPGYNYGTFSVNVYAAKVGNPTEECGLEIWGDTGGLPDPGKFICFALQPNTKFGQESAAWIEFMLVPYSPPDFIGLKYNTTYWAVFYQHNRSGNSSNYYYWHKYAGVAGSGGPYARGRAATTTDGGASWSIKADEDMTFFTFADRLLVPTAPTGLTPGSTDSNNPTVVDPFQKFDWNDNPSSEYVDWYNFTYARADVTTVVGKLPTSEWTPAYGLSSGYTYAIKAQAHNNAGVGTHSTPDLYIHTNTAPAAPYDPLPESGAIATPPVTLTWQGGDNDPGDTVTYKVYLGSAPTSLTLQQDSDSSDTSCPISNLTSGGVYYWYVEAKDNHGATSRGPATGTWSFIVKNNTTLTIKEDVSTYYFTPVDITATLKDTKGTPDPADDVRIPNKTINFIIGANEGYTDQKGTAATGANGEDAVFKYTPSLFMKAGTYSIEAEFKGDADIAAATASPKTLTITRKTTSMSVDYDFKTVTRKNAIKLGACLTGAWGVAVYGKTITFYDWLVLDGNGNPTPDSTSIGSDSTDSNGWAYIDWIPETTGTKVIWAVFVEDEEYESSKASGSVIVSGQEANSPPNAPTNPSPPDKAAKAGRYNEYSQLVVDLSWQCTDPDEDDTLTYDVYLDKKIDETTQPTTKLNTTPITTASWTTGPLTDGATYVWKVAPKDSEGATSPADQISVWSFTVGIGGAAANVFYVSTVGYDGWTGRVRTPVESDGVFIDGPWGSITKAAATMAAGDTTVVLGGNYGAEHIVFANGGVDWSSAITLEAEGEVTIDGGGAGGTGIRIDGKGYIYIQGSSKITSHFNIYNYDKGISIANGTSIMVKDCELMTNGDGIYLNATTDTNISNNNIFFSNRTGVVLFGSSNNNRIEENNIYNSTTANASDSGTGNTWNNNYYGDCPDYPNAGDNPNGYAGSDLNADGFGDTPYTFTTGSDAQPLMDPVEPPATRTITLQVAP